jgi:NADH-quinone oxidoreductase subunit H
MLTGLALILLKIALVLGGILTAAAYLVLLERRVAAWVQDRRGPNRVGIPLTNIRLFGLGQPLADGLKMILKEEYTPAHVDRRMYWLAPLVIMVSALAVFAVIPVGSVLPPLPVLGIDRPVPLLIAPGVDVAVLYVFAFSSVAVYGVLLGGWSSNSKYSFLGGLRSSAQLIAYELPLGLGLLGVVLTAGSLRLDDIIQHQAATGIWHALLQPLGFIVFVVAAFAEAARLPFDLPEAEQELVGGYHTEYSGMKLVLFLTAEFIHMITASFLIVILFLGGWHLPWGLTGSGMEIGWGMALWRVAVIHLKVLAVILFFMVVRWTWPRFRFDQLMSLAWKIMLPLGLVNLLAVAVVEELLHPAMAGRWLERVWPWSATAFASLAGWMVLVVSWLAVAVLAPRIADNRPRNTLDWQIDSQLPLEA